MRTLCSQAPIGRTPPLGLEKAAVRAFLPLQWCYRRMPSLKALKDCSSSLAFVFFFAASLEWTQTVGDQHLHSGQNFIIRWKEFDFEVRQLRRLVHKECLVQVRAGKVFLGGFKPLGFFFGGGGG